MTQEYKLASKAAHDSSKHWIIQRMSALMVLVFLIWFIQFAYQMSGKDIKTILYELNLPDNIGCFSILVVSSLYHGVIGMQVIIEDYVSSEKCRKVYIVGLKVFIYITIILFAAAVIGFHKFDLLKI